MEIFIYTTFLYLDLDLYSYLDLSFLIIDFPLFRLSFIYTSFYISLYLYYHLKMKKKGRLPFVLTIGSIVGKMIAPCKYRTYLNRLQNGCITFMLTGLLLVSYVYYLVFNKISTLYLKTSKSFKLKPIA